MCVGSGGEFRMNEILEVRSVFKAHMIKLRLKECNVHYKANLAIPVENFCLFYVALNWGVSL